MTWHERQAVREKRRTERAGRPARSVRKARKAAKDEAARQKLMDALNPFAGPVPVGLEIHPGPRLLGLDLARPGSERTIVADSPAGRAAVEHMLGADALQRFAVRELDLGGERVIVVDELETGQRVALVRGRP